MRVNQIVTLLRDAANRYASLPFERFESLKHEHWFGEIGSPSETLPGDYCQIETELLECFIENGVDVLHISVIARDEYREFSTCLFIFSNGELRLDNNVFEFIDGTPHLFTGILHE